MVDVLPSSLITTPFTRANARLVNGTYEIPVYCANCGKLGLWVPETALEQVGGEFVFYLCPKCDAWAPIAGLMKVPDEVFAENCREDLEGKSPEQVAIELEDVNSTLSLLKRERAKGLPS